MTIFTRRQRPRGLTAVAVLVCLIIVTMVAGSVLKVALAQRDQTRAQERRLQAEWLAEAGTVLHDEQAITITDESSDAEDRFVTLGMDALGRVLVVVYTWRGDRPRLISARKATPRECRHYEGTR